TKANGKNSTKLYLKSFNPIIDVGLHSYYFTPESIGFAAYDHPESIDLSGYNKSCLNEWAKEYNKSVDACMTNKRTSILDIPLLCQAVSRPWEDKCDTRWKRTPMKCMFFALNLGERMERIAFPDGRRIVSIVWNCSSIGDCTAFGCV
ncbi:hypothetical protein PMAYCL1PPCAC_21243, partial [Pristionchus mayeri]